MAIPRRGKEKTIDFGTIAMQADLPSMLASEGIEIRNGKAFCPFHGNDQTEALSVYRQSDRRWQFKCHSCGEKGDAIDWIARREGISKSEAARKLDGGDRSIAGHVNPKSPNSSKIPGRDWMNPSWQWTASDLIKDAQNNLWKDDAWFHPSHRGSPARAWLHKRGIKDETMRRFNLGFLPDDLGSSFNRDDGTIVKVKLPRGIVIPWAAPGGFYGEINLKNPGTIPRWVGINVRLLAGNPFAPLPDGVDKCQCMTGSQRGFPYPETLLPSQGDRPCLVVEGELDALLAWQEVGHFVNVITVGSAKQKPRSEAIESAGRCPWSLLALDRDRAGQEGVMVWRNALEPGKTRRLLIPYEFKDIGDMAVAGESIEHWLRAELDRLELSPKR